MQYTKDTHEHDRASSCERGLPLEPRPTGGGRVGKGAPTALGPTVSIFPVPRQIFHLYPPPLYKLHQCPKLIRPGPWSGCSGYMAATR